MANRNWYPNHQALEIDVCHLYAEINIGAAGAVSSSSGKGIASVTRDSAGKYTIALQDSYNKLLHASGVVLDATNEDPTTAGIQPRLFSESVNSAAPAIAIQFYDHATGAAADPANGAKVYVQIQLRNSSVS